MRRTLYMYGMHHVSTLALPLLSPLLCPGLPFPLSSLNFHFAFVESMSARGKCPERRHRHVSDRSVHSASMSGGQQDLHALRRICTASAVLHERT